MRKIIAAMNMTLDGFCDHTEMTADDEVHWHYTELLQSADTIIYGRITYQLMEFWPPIVANPTGNKAMDEFAVAIDDIQKIVYSRTLQHVDWKNTVLKSELVKEEIMALKEQEGRSILVGSPSMIIALTNLNLVDEYQLSIQPIILGSGLRLLKNIDHRTDLKLIKTKTFGCGAVTFYHERVKNE